MRNTHWCREGQVQALGLDEIVPEADDVPEPAPSEASSRRVPAQEAVSEVRVRAREPRDEPDGAQKRGSYRREAWGQGVQR
jgi:hypothetical protein